MRIKEKKGYRNSGSDCSRILFIFFDSENFPGTTQVNNGFQAAFRLSGLEGKHLCSICYLSVLCGSHNTWWYLQQRIDCIKNNEQHNQGQTLAGGNFRELLCCARGMSCHEEPSWCYRSIGLSSHWMIQ